MRKLSTAEAYRSMLERGHEPADAVIEVSGAQCCAEGRDETERVLLGLLYGLLISSIEPTMAGAMLETFGLREPRMQVAMSKTAHELADVWRPE